MAIAKKTTPSQKTTITWNIDEPNAKQIQAMKADTLYVGYGGAKGGGKTWFIQHKAVGGALQYPGIKILIMRAHYPELEQNHIQPIKAMIARMGGDEVATYNGTHRILTFYNGSQIKFGHWSGEESESEYQGLEFDWIFMDEATQFSERTFNYLGGCLRGTNDVPKRFYITCNPGGIGHRWVKRLFIDRQYKTNCKNPEENENPNDYTFIFATVEDNQAMLKKSPTYLRTLANMPEDLREAYRYGNWDAIGGNYFKEFTPGKHTCRAFKIPSHWQRYRSFDYGLDKFAICWWAVDEDGRAWCYRYYEHSDLIISQAAKDAVTRTMPNERISATYAPPDMWGRVQETGKTRAEVFFENGLNIIKADNNRVKGHMLMKEAMADIPLKDETLLNMYADAGKEPPKRLPGIIFFDDLEKVINDIRDIQSDENNPDDCAKEPHEVTHSVDAVRYFVVSRVIAAEAQKKADELNGYEEDEKEDYEDFMLGGQASADYMAY